MTNLSRLRFTKAEINELMGPTDGKKQIRYRDEVVQGLYLRVAKGGTKTFVFYRKAPGDNKPTEITIGKYPETTIDQARNAATKYNAILAQGKCIQEERRLEESGRMSYQSLHDRYINDYAKKRTKSWELTERFHKLHFKELAPMPLQSITRHRLQQWINNLAVKVGPAAANRCADQVKFIFNYGINKGHFEGANPAAKLDTFKRNARERFIQPGKEFEAFMRALEQEPCQTNKDFFLLSLFTGARKTNVISMRWQDLNLQTMTWTLPETKNGDSLTIPLSSEAMSILKRRFKDKSKHEIWVLPSQRPWQSSKGHITSPQGAMERLLERAGMKDFRIHDLRRTAGSYMAQAGVSLAIIGKALGHRSQQSTAIYARLTVDPVRQALESSQTAFKGRAHRSHKKIKTTRPKKHNR